ncbi:probable beta-1,4-xylosyltransferase IRX9 [Olea europaea subsp. europaea]|uniref:Glycosyltransferases n=1 Tax=Olea europaea subsp. europaea TaxID=158383 RepID=A0A8S0V2B0_OLEEU|nr:probable beta-1,4-xylosyltransferase IRX9 [Olea europaea subsp. europaea]
MGSLERSKKKVQLWKKAIVHFLLCFVMGFFTGFAPTDKSSIFSNGVAISNHQLGFSPQPVAVINPVKGQNFTTSELEETAISTTTKESLNLKKPNGGELNPRRLVIIVTPTSKMDRLRGVLLRRLANTLKLVAQPLLWIIVEQFSDSAEVSEILRNTGIMYRHVVFKENFTDIHAEMDHQRNLALKHIEHHRLSGIVHFASLSNVYDLSFFQEIRAIEAFGTWPIAKLYANKKKVIIQGPVCDSSEVIGWHLKKIENTTDTTALPIHISSFAFNSSILWDPERWGRTSSAQRTSQNVLKFVKKEVLEEDTKLKGIPQEGCSKVLLWNLHIFKP